MNKRLGILEFDNPSFPTVTDHDYDNYEGFDAYPMKSMPMHMVDSETDTQSKKKEIIYL